MKSEVNEKPAKRVLAAMTKFTNTEPKLLQKLRDAFDPPIALPPANEGDIVNLAQGPPDTDEMEKSANAER